MDCATALDAAIKANAVTARQSLTPLKFDIVFSAKSRIRAPSGVAIFSAD
jgi:hypothetical protein